ncbi:fungal-specific transcription factor domain-containing protein [Armillaria luteobubalina]|uniref:Fungal-specific transcription factor domain-containing protein n=1 Tax=Armillaria luteobubalina TaxID=153913 RepID=A0AA39ULZ2_9AGAR|nr:fungal-specific transcription factor domain-containing protein [Armillaria luteobubalina]
MPPVTTSDTQQETQTSSILKERRFKLSRACDRCRRRRIKCDEGHPCQACLTANSACTFEEPGKRTHPHKSKRTATLEDRMHHLETLIQAIPPAVFAAGGAAAVNPAKQSSPTDINSPAFAFPAFPSGIPPPSLHVFPLTNPSTHFSPPPQSADGRQRSPSSSFQSLMGNLFTGSGPDTLVDDTSRMSLTASYLYFDDEGYTRWQGETSGLPLLDLLVERHNPSETASEGTPSNETASAAKKIANSQEPQWFPNRTPRRTHINPQTLWSMITTYIEPELMDSLVQCYLSTSYYILPFIHVPTFLADYGNPQKWGEPGFAAFIVSICCLASRHMDDPRVRADPNDSISAGTHWFELLGRLRTLPTADRPTLYTIQANLIAAVYAIGLGRLSKGAALLSEAITVSVDAGLHRSADTYDLFDPIEDEVRKRTFWCVYIWDKQLSAHFGRPPMIRLRDCDVGEPAPVDDEYITHDGVGVPPPGTECRLSAFIFSLRIFVVAESVLDVPPARQSSSPFMAKAAALLTGSSGCKLLKDEEMLLDEIHRSIPPLWSQSAETLGTEDTIRLTQAERLHCAEHFVRLLIHRHRFSQMVAERHAAGGDDEQQTEAEKEAMVAAHNSALQIAAAHLHIARKGLMTYYGVHVIHQLTQAGRTLVAVLLNCKSDALQHLIPSGLDALRSCIGLLRRFSGRYICGLRSGDLMEEFCRLTQIPLEATPQQDNVQNDRRPPWIRPVRKKAPSIARSNCSGESPSPEAFSPSDFLDAQKAAGPSSSFPSAPPSSGTPVTKFEQPSFADGSGNMNMDIIGNEQLYMSPSDVMSLFNDGSVDLGQIFSPEFIQPPSSSDGNNIGGGGEPYLKMTGIVTSP